MKLNKRLERLEEEFICEPTKLFMPDGTTETIAAPKRHLLDLFGVAVSREPGSPQQSKQLDLIEKCIGSEEPGGAHMIDLIRCFQEGPVQDARESEPTA